MKPFILSVICMLLTAISVNSQSVINAGGNYTGNVNWSADTVKITANITISGTLNIQHGTYVEFQGYFQITADSIKAIGCEGDSITFTVHDTTGFSNRIITAGGWKKIGAGKYLEFKYCKIMYGKNIEDDSHLTKSARKGILFLGGNGDMDTGDLKIHECLISSNYSISLFIASDSPGLIINHCVLKDNQFDHFTKELYPLKWQISNTFFTGNSGVIENTIMKKSIFTFNDNLEITASEDEYLYIEDCLFENNENLILGPGGSAYSKFRLINTKIINNVDLILRDHESYQVYIIGNLICNNLMIKGFDFYMSSSLHFINNTICNNSIKDGSSLLVFNPYYPTDFFNNILFGNSETNVNGKQISFLTMPDFTVTEFRGNFKYNLIEGGLDAFEYNGFNGVYENNIDGNPQFVDAVHSDYHLSAFSPCINTGIPDTTGLKLLQIDMEGNPRVFDGRIDMGAYEGQEDIILNSDDPDLDDSFVVFPNPIIAFGILKYPSGMAVKIEIFDATGTLLKTIQDQDLDGQTEVDFESYPYGVFFCRVTDSYGNSYSTKVLK